MMRVGAIVDHLVAELSQAAFMIWPEWYGASRLQNVVTKCQQLQPPYLREFTNDSQAKQLSLALGTASTTVLVDVRDESPSQERLLGLARAAEWFCRVADLPLLQVLKPSLSARPDRCRLHCDRRPADCQ